MEQTERLESEAELIKYKFNGKRIIRITVAQQILTSVSFQRTYVVSKNVCRVVEATW